MRFRCRSLRPGAVPIDPAESEEIRQRAENGKSADREETAIDESIASRSQSGGNANPDAYPGRSPARKPPEAQADQNRPGSAIHSHRKALAASWAGGAVRLDGRATHR